MTDPDKRVELFDQLMEQYNEDTGESSYPHGYCFTSGTMVTEFEDACKALDTYEGVRRGGESARLSRHSAHADPG